MVLKAVVSQQLVPAKNGTLVPAFEIMAMTPAISNMIRDNKVHQIDGIIYTSAREDMISMDNSLLNLYRKGIITQETVIQYFTLVKRGSTKELFLLYFPDQNRLCVVEDYV